MQEWRNATISLTSSTALGRGFVREMPSLRPLSFFTTPFFKSLMLQAKEGRSPHRIA
nr:MAG TPA: hypothetical protein [Caudoviricetes sp.]